MMHQKLWIMLIVALSVVVGLVNFASAETDGFLYAAMENDTTQGNYVDNHLEANPANGIAFFEVEYRQSVTLAVVASCDQGNLHYHWTKQWYQSPYFYNEELPYEDASIEVIVTEPYRDYTCVVTDDYGGSIEVSFSVQMDNIVINGTQPEMFSYYNDVGDTIVLSVDAECKVGQLSYRWLREGNEIEGETANTLTITIDSLGYHSYVCKLSDNLGNSADIWFGLHYNNNLTANDDQRIVKPLGANASLHTIASCREGGLSYRWFQHITGWNDPELDEKSDTLSITVNDIYSLYYCIVSDDYNDGETVDYYVLGAQPINMGESKKIKMPHGYRFTYLSIKPVISGMYQISTLNPDVVYGTGLYDEDMSLIFSADESHIYELQAGKQYYYGICPMSNFEDDIPVSFNIISEVVPDLVLPSSLKAIESQAFKGIPAYSVVYVPETVTQIADDAFDPQTVILSPENSPASKWALKHGLPVAFSSIDK